MTPVTPPPLPLSDVDEAIDRLIRSVANDTYDGVLASGGCKWEAERDRLLGLFAALRERLTAAEADRDELRLALEQHLGDLREAVGGGPGMNWTVAILSARSARSALADLHEIRNGDIARIYAAETALRQAQADLADARRLAEGRDVLLEEARKMARAEWSRAEEAAARARQAQAERDAATSNGAYLARLVSDVGRERERYRSDLMAAREREARLVAAARAVVANLSDLDAVLTLADLLTTPTPTTREEA